MAFATLNFSIVPSDNWVKVADDPTYVSIRARDNRPWELCVTASGAPSLNGENATGTITFSGLPVEDETVTVGAVTYTFVTLAATDFVIGADIEETRDNLLAAIDTAAAVTAVASGDDAIAIGPETAAPTSWETDNTDAFVMTWAAEISFAGLPTATDTITVGTTTFTFVAGAPGVDEIEIGADAEETRDNALAAIAADAQVTAASSGADGITITPIDPGVEALVALSEAADNVTIAWDGVITVAEQPDDADTIQVDGDTFTAESVAIPNVVIGADAEETRDNLIVALGPNTAVTAAPSSTNVIALTASAPGTAGNAIVLTEAATNVAVSGAGVLAGGVDASAYMSFNPNNQEDGWHFTKSTSTTGEFYIRTKQPGAFGEGMVFGVIRDQ